MSLSLAQLQHPIVQAPMGGGASTPALAAAVSDAGGLGFLAAGYKSPDGVRQEVQALRERTSSAFGVNVFVPSGVPAADAVIERYAATLQGDAEQHGVELGEPRHDDDGWHDKLQLVADKRVPVVSFSFGCPPAEVIDELRRRGAAVWVTVTHPREATVAARAGADALVVQGVEAGAHRGSFDDQSPGEISLLPLLQLVAAVVDTPMVATGGLATGHAVAAVLAAGASAAQLGTAFMLTPEAGTSPTHREALRGDNATALTRAFSGRTARGIVNRFLREHSADAPSAYPEVHHLTSPLRAAARASGDADAMHLWAGEAHSLAEEVPAGELVRRLGEDARRVLAETARRFEPGRGP